MRLDFKIVEIRYALGRRLRIVATRTILVVEQLPEPALVVERNLLDLEVDFLLRLRGGAGDELVAACHFAQAHRRGELSTGVSEAPWRIETHSSRAAERNGRAGNGIS